MHVSLINFFMQLVLVFFRSDLVKCSTVEVEYLNTVVKTQKEKVQELEAKLEEYANRNNKLDVGAKQKDNAIETLEKR